MSLSLTGGLSAGLSAGMLAATSASGMVTDFGAAAAAGKLHGLAPAFKVTVSNTEATQYEGISDLGFWSSCKGLKVSWDTLSIKTGNYSQRNVNLILGIKYDNVVLKRGMSKAAWAGADGSSGIRNWLVRMAKPPSQDDGPDWTNLPVVSVTLYDVWFQAVAVWNLLDCYPVSWEGPDLDASSKQVAYETLTLCHRGFLDESTKIPDPSQAGGTDASAGAAIEVGSHIAELMG